MSCHRLRQAGTAANPPGKHTVLASKAARASLATVVAELAQALPKITSCKGAASFAKTGKLMIRWRNAPLTKMYASGHAQEATILFQAKTTTRETQLGKDVEKQNGINTASVAALLKERLQWRPAITQHYCCNQCPAGRNHEELLLQLVAPSFDHLCTSSHAPQRVLLHGGIRP